MGEKKKSLKQNGKGNESAIECQYTHTHTTSKQMDLKGFTKFYQYSRDRLACLYRFHELRGLPSMPTAGVICTSVGGVAGVARLPQKGRGRWNRVRVEVNL